MIAKPAPGVAQPAGFSAWPPNSLRIAESTLVGELAEPAGFEPLIQGGGDDGGGHTFLDGGQHRPAALTGIGHPTAKFVQLGRAGQCVGNQVDQPGSDHRAAAPDLGTSATSISYW